MRNKIIISLICLSLAFILFFYPFFTLLHHYISAAPLIGEGEEFTLSEPAILLLLGSGLIGIGVFARKRVKSKPRY